VRSLSLAGADRFRTTSLLAEKCCFGLASRVRSEQSDEQSAEQLQKVKHPKARIAHRGICAIPDTIFGSHKLLPMILIGVWTCSVARERSASQAQTQADRPLSPTRCRRCAICLLDGCLPSLTAQADFIVNQTGPATASQHDGASTVIALTTAAASGGRTGLTSSNRQTDLCVATSLQL
jgi:hypothetical protein